MYSRKSLRFLSALISMASGSPKRFEPGESLKLKMPSKKSKFNRNFYYIILL